MLFYLMMAIVLFSLVHYNVLIFKRRNYIIPTESKIHQKKLFNYSLGQVLTKSYLYITASALVVFFGITSAFVGSLLGVILFVQS